MNHFAILMVFLRDRSQFLTDIDHSKKLDRAIVAFLSSSSAFFAIYGAIMGSFSGWLQMFSSAIKLPALYLITLMICLPTLFFFEIIISGSKRSFTQYLALLLASISLISVMLFGFAPITLFFRISIDNYLFFKFLNVTILAISGFIGISFFYQSMLHIGAQEIDTLKFRNKVIFGWLALYGFVGCQLGWTLRPFFGAPGAPFELVRELEGNFYLHFLKMIAEALGFN